VALVLYPLVPLLFLLLQPVQVEVQVEVQPAVQ